MRTPHGPGSDAVAACPDAVTTPPATVPAPGRRLRRRTRLERRNRLVEAHRDLVRPIARHYGRCTAEPLEDLLQVGLLGLIRAAELFQSSQGSPFEAFARPHIRGAILHHLRDCAPAVRLPRRQAELQDRLLRLQRERIPQGTASLVELAGQLGVDADHLALLLRQRQLNRPLPLEPELEDHLEAPDPPEQPGDTLIGGLGLEGGAERLLARLEPRQRLVVRQVVLGGMSYRELSRRMAVSPMTVQRLLQRGLERLRAELADPALSPCLPGGHGRSAAPAC